jgi:nucleolar protein 12
MKVKKNKEKKQKTQKPKVPENEEEEEEEMKIEDPITENDEVIEKMDGDDNTDSSDDDDEETKDKDGKKNAENEKSGKTRAEKIAERKSDESKTVFCGNIPNAANVNKTRIKDLFAQYGTIKSIRLRTNTGDKIFAKKDKKKVPSFNAYIVFDNEADAKSSVQLNGHKLVDNHLRVNMANEKREAFSSKGTIFVGNLPFESKEDEIHEFFTTQVGEIEYVRIIPKKGICFVCFKKGVNLATALKLNDTEFKGRKLRISRNLTKEKQERKKMFKKDDKTGRVMKQKAKKNPKINSDFVNARPNINNPIIKKIRDSQKAKFNKYTDGQQPSKKDLFRPGGKIDRNNRNMNREKDSKKKKFFGAKVDDTKKFKKGNNNKKGKVSKGIKDQKVIAKKLKSAAMRVKS